MFKQRLKSMSKTKLMACFTVACAAFVATPPSLAATPTLATTGPTGVRAFDTGFAVRNNAALTQTLALPPIGAPWILRPGHSLLRAQLDWTNEYVTQQAGHESLLEDGETQRYALSLHHGFAGGPWGGFELGISLPLVVNNGGVMDGIIHNYHNVLNLPDGGRGQAPHGLVRYRYMRDGSQRLAMTSSGTNLGDMTLSAGVQAKPGLALRAEVKLPTGTANYLTGGNWGGALWLDYDPFTGMATPWFGFISLGGSYNATSDVLPKLQRHAILLGGLGLGFHFTQKFALLAQFYAHSPLYKHTAISALHKMGLQGTFGARYAFSPHFAVEAGFQEDLVTDSSPDFGVHLALVVR